MSNDMPCSNTALLDKYEIDQDRMDRIQKLRDIRAKELMQLYNEDPTYWLEHLGEDQTKKLAADIWFFSSLAEITDYIENDMKRVSELQAILEVTTP